MLSVAGPRDRGDLHGRRRRPPDPADRRELRCGHRPPAGDRESQRRWADRSGAAGRPDRASCPAPGACVEAVGVDIRTGEVRWQVQSRPGNEILFDRAVPPRHLGEFDPTAGRVVVRELSTGTVVGEVTLPRWDAGVGRAHDVTIIGDAVLDLYVAVRSLGQASSATVTSLTLTGRREWTSEAPLHPPTEGYEVVFIDSCGRVLCVRDTGGATLLEPGSGRVLDAVDGRVLHVLADDQLLIWPIGRPDEPTHGTVLLDPVTGERRPTPDQTVILARPGGGSIVISTMAETGLSDVVLRDAGGHPQLLGTIGAVADARRRRPGWRASPAGPAAVVAVAVAVAVASHRMPTAG